MRFRVVCEQRADYPALADTLDGWCVVSSVEVGGPDRWERAELARTVEDALAWVEEREPGKRRFSASRVAR